MLFLKRKNESSITLKPHANKEHGLGRNFIHFVHFLLHWIQCGVFSLLLQKVGCRILKVFSNMCPQSSDRVVQCIGKANECMDAISDILLLIKEVPIKGTIQNYDPINYDDYLADKYGGFGGDGSGNGGNRNSNNNNNNRGGGQSKHLFYIFFM